MKAIRAISWHDVCVFGLPPKGRLKEISRALKAHSKRLKAKPKSQSDEDRA
jgi:hypothetical protein